MKINNTFKLIIAIVVSELAGIIGSIFTTPSIPIWYAGIAKPALNPPAWVFGPVWTTLFALMGIAAFLIWKKGLDRRDVKIALGIFIGQLVLNALWSIVFFGLHNPCWAFVEIIFLWLAILATIIVFAKISKPVVWLLVPYILWVSFAGYLNYSIWQLSTNKPGQIACTEEAKLCPDGSAVGRIGPNCEFALCPRINSLFSETEARVIAEKSCIKGGETLVGGVYNENSKTWWYDANLNSTREGCNPACVVSEETKTAEINWRCTGLIVPKGSVEAIQKLFTEKYPKYAKTITVSVNQETQDYARGSVTFEAGAPGGIFLAAKIDGKWQIVFDGNGAISCNLSKYGFPNEMLVDCAE